MNETGAEGEYGDEKEVTDQWPLPAESIGEETEDDLGTGRRGKERYRKPEQNGVGTYGTNGTEQQSERDGGCLVQGRGRSEEK